jgi:hypothetical protein
LGLSELGQEFCKEGLVVNSRSRSWKSNRLLKNAEFVIARRAKPDVAIQPFIDFTDDLDCFASLAMTILAEFLSFSAACQRIQKPA